MFRGNSGFLASVPPVTRNLLIVNALFWLASVTLPTITQRLLGSSFDVIDYLGMHFLMSDKFNVIQLVSYMFLHDTRSLTHIFFNMFSVFMFGRVLENYWGGKRFITFYMITGLGAAIVQQIMWCYEIWSFCNVHGYVYLDFLLNGDTSALVTIGASGAVFGILLAFGMLFPNTPLYIMFIPIPVKAKYVMIGYGVIELFMGVANFSGDNVAHFAHLGGMLFAYFIIRHWKKNNEHYGNRYF